MAFYRFGSTGGNYYRPSMFGGGFRFFPPVIKWLLISNVAIWLLADVFLAPFTIQNFPIGGSRGLITQYFALWPIASENFFPWQMVSYMFMHGGFGHILFNMLALWMFGMELENSWGARRFLIFYVVCGLGAGLANLLISPLIGQAAPTVGASGAVFGVLIAFGMLYPDRPIYLYFLLPVKAKYFIAGYIALELFFLYSLASTGTSDGIAHFAHLGGAAVGFVYVLAMTGRLPLGRWWSIISGGPDPYSGKAGRVGSRDEVRDATFYDIRTGKETHDEDEVTQEIIDAILDKISVSGYQSLSEKEKQILNTASKKIH